jgi:phosphopantothenoylcysteine decarboxylase
MSRIVLGVTASVAAIKVTEIVGDMISSHHEVKLVSTRNSLHFYDPIEIANKFKNSSSLLAIVSDGDEWIGSGTNHRYQRGDEILHIELRRWADILVVAPMDANTLGKFALGLAEGCLASLWRSWDWTKPVVLVPSMNTNMWIHPVTCRHLKTLAEDIGVKFDNTQITIGNIIAFINSKQSKLNIVTPIEKTLACGDYGMGAMASSTDILKAIASCLSA